MIYGGLVQLRLLRKAVVG